MKKILVVDDERDMQMLFQQRFRKEIRDGEIEFGFAFSGEEALQYMQGHQQEAILILSDINMPGMSGLELLGHIKEKYENPPPFVMMITAYGDDNNHQQATQYGCDDYLTKPLDFEELKRKIAKQIEN